MTFYRFNSKTNSTVGQLNSTFGTGVNELRVAYTRVRDRRGAQPFEQKPFPQVTVDAAPAARRSSPAARTFSTANELDQDIVELTDDVHDGQGQAHLTVGTHNEFFKFRNLFIRDNFGTYRFSSLDQLRGGPGAAVRLQLLGDGRSEAGARSSASTSSASTPATSGARGRT